MREALDPEGEIKLALPPDPEPVYGPPKPTLDEEIDAIYRELCEQYIKQPPPGFDVQIVLTEK